jgi:tetratricopeptide (TPR) repeat protein
MRSFMAAVAIVLWFCASSSAQDRNAGEALAHGNFIAAQGQYQTALSIYRDALPTSGDSRAVITYNIGVCDYHLGRLTEAVAEYQSAIALRRGHYQRAFYALGVALSDLGDLPGARVAFAHALKLSHNRDGEAAFDLGLVLARGGEYEAAASYFRQAIARQTQSLSAAHNNLGVLALAGQWKQAAHEFEIASRIGRGSSDEIEHNLHLCQSCFTGTVRADRDSWRLMNSLD